jgi:poly(3-hydroxybutyrate) depolymerase
VRSALAVLCFAACRVLAAEPLPALGAEQTVTVSGLSSGGYMAVQLHVAHSSIVKGAAVIAAGPYYCAQGSVFSAYYNCMQPGLFAPLPRTTTLRAEAEARARSGDIDPTSNLAASRAWLFIGAKDPEVDREVVDALAAFYEGYKVATLVIKNQPAGHAMATVSAGNADCAATKSPFINACKYDAAGELLRYLYGKLEGPAAKPSGRLARFDQSAFGGADISMADEGYVFIPSVCESASCRIHVALHGCRQGAEDVGENFVRDAGYNRWAETNRLIVLYPQAIRRSGWSLFNPRGCWDWWGYTGRHYHTKHGPQIRALKAMLERLGAAR